MSLSFTAKVHSALFGWIDGWIMDGWMDHGWMDGSLMDGCHVRWMGGGGDALFNDPATLGLSRSITEHES